MKSYVIISKAFQKSSRVSPLLFATVFCLEAAPVFSAIFVSITKRPLSQLAGTLFGLVPFLMAMLLFTAYFDRNRINKGEINKERLSGKLLFGYSGIITSFLMFLGLMILAWKAYASLSLLAARYVLVYAGLTYPIYFGFIIIVLVLSILMMAGLSTFFAFGLYPALPLAYPRYFLKIFRLIFLRVPVTLTMLVTLLVGTIAFRLLNNNIVILLDYLFYDALASRLVYILMTAALEAFIFNFSIRITEALLESSNFQDNKNATPTTAYTQPDKGISDTQSTTPAQVPFTATAQVAFTPSDFVKSSENKKVYGLSLPYILKSFIPPVALAIVLLVLARSVMPIAVDSSVKAYEDMILTHMATGDIMMLDPDQLDLSSYNYRKAYGMVKSFQGYIKTIMAEQDPSFASLKTEAAKDFDSAAAYDRTSPYYYLFRGYWFESNKNVSEAIRHYKISLEILPSLADAGFACCRLEIQQNNATALKASIDSIVYAGNFRESYYAIKSLKPDNLKKLLKDYNKTGKYLFEKLAVSALEKYNINDVKGMYDDIAIMLKAEPDSPNLILLQAIAAMAYRPEQYNYPVAEAAFEKLTGMVPENEEIFEYYGRMLLTSGNYEKAASMYETLYKKYPENPILGEQYAYSLMAGSHNAEAINVCNKVLAKYPKDWLCHYIKAISLLKSFKYQASLNSIHEFVKYSQTLEYRQSYDMFLNSFCLAYSLETMKPEAMSALDNLPGGSLLEPYVLGITAWRDRDLSKGLKYIDTVLNIDPMLGLAWYTKASILFEQSKSPNEISMTELESIFIKAASLQPSSLEVWFSLGNFYKAWGNHDKEALRAYRRVVDLEPNSDHLHDYYGVVFHALLEIDRLKANEFSVKED